MSEPGLLLTREEDELSDVEDANLKESPPKAGPGNLDVDTNHLSEENGENDKENFSLFEDQDEEDDEDEDENEVQNQANIALEAGTVALMSNEAFFASSSAQSLPERVGRAGYVLDGRTVLPPHSTPDLLCDLTAFASNIPNVSDRFKNALSRVQSSAQTDVEAWQALLSEAQLSFRTEWAKLQKMLELAYQGGVHQPMQHANQWVDFAKFDLLESIYGALLQTFPFSGIHYAGAVEMLLLISSYSRKQQYKQPGSGTITEVEIKEDLSTLLSPDVAMELTRRRNAADRKAAHMLCRSLGVNMEGAPYFGENMSEKDGEGDQHPTGEDLTSKVVDQDPQYLVRGAMCSSHISLWMLYIQKITRDTQRRLSSQHVMSATDDLIHTDADARTSMIAAFETSVKHAGFVSGCHTLWRSYVNYLNTSFQALQQQTKATANHTQSKHTQMLHLRSVYQRLIGTPIMNLETEFWREFEAFEQNQSEALAQALIAEHLPRMQHAKQVYLDRLAYAPTPSKNDHGPVSSGSVAGIGLLQIGRLPTPPASSENEAGMAMERALWTSWQKRLLYERSNPERLSSTSELTLRIRQVYKEAICVLMRHPEVWHEWASWEAYGLAGGGRKVACQVLEWATSSSRPALLSDCALLSASLANLLEEAGDVSAATACLERYVHRSPCGLGYILLQRLVRRTQGIQAARLVFSRARRSLRDPDYVSSTFGTDKSKKGANSIVTGPIDTTKRNTKESKTGSDVVANAPLYNGLTVNRIQRKARVSSGKVETLGSMTWHLFASHAHMEFRNNKCPEVAARVFELGLARHPSFLTCPSYVLAYARLLLDKGEEDNLRSLLERSIAACEETDSFVSKHGQHRLWDFLLEFECLHSRNCGDPGVIHNIESRRRRALGIEEPVKALMPKPVLDQLLRSDGDASGVITGGLGHLLERYELVGMLGDGDKGSDIFLTAQEKSTTYGAREVDTSFSKRHYRALHPESGHALSSSDFFPERPRAARERVQTGGSQSNAFGLMSQTAYPEWLRSFVAVLPVPRFHRFNAKPPPHMIEMTLSSLKSSTLLQRPTGADGASREAPLLGKRRRADGDSSDEEGTLGTGGYGGQFRMRQRARQALGT